MFEFNLQKALESILFFAHKELQVNKSDIDLIKINKYSYFSEQLHLKKYLRPIFGDTYSALPEGPVPSTLYDIIKWIRGDRNAFMEKVLKAVTNDIEIPIKFYFPFYIAPLREPNLKKFSKSEIEVMENVFRDYHEYSSDDLSLLSHKEPAWKNAVAASKNEMDFQEIIGNPEAWAYIQEKVSETQTFRASF